MPNLPFCARWICSFLNSILHPGQLPLMHFPNRAQVSLMSVWSSLTGQLQHIAAPPTISCCCWIVAPGLNTPHRELAFLQRVYLWVLSLVENFRLLTDTGTLPNSSLNRPAVCTSTYTRGRLHREAGRGEVNHTPTHTKWEGSLSEASPAGHTLLTCCEQHSPPEHLSDLIEIIHVLLLEHCHARCPHWRSLSPWCVPLKASTSPTLLIQRRVLADARLEWCKGLLHVPACCVAFHLYFHCWESPNHQKLTGGGNEQHAAVHMSQYWILALKRVRLIQQCKAGGWQFHSV